MKNILLTITLLITTLSFSQIRINNTDRQKVTTFELQGVNLNFQIENDVLQTVDLSGLSGGTDDQTASEVPITDSGALYTATDVEGALAEVKGLTDTAIQEHPDTGQTGIRVGVGTEAEKALATLGASDVWISTDADPIKVETTATFDLSENKVFNDTSDASTITVSGLEAAVEFYIYIDRATAPTLSGATFDPIDGTTAFEANVPMILYGIVHPNKTTINYCYVKL